MAPLTAGGVDLGVGDLERLVLAQRAQSLSLVERRDPEMSAKRLLDDLGVTLVEPGGPYLGGTSHLGIEIDGELALDRRHEPSVARDAMT